MGNSNGKWFVYHYRDHSRPICQNIFKFDKIHAAYIYKSTLFNIKYLTVSFLLFNSHFKYTYIFFKGISSLKVVYNTDFWVTQILYYDDYYRRVLLNDGSRKVSPSSPVFSSAHPSTASYFFKSSVYRVAGYPILSLQNRGLR